MPMVGDTLAGRYRIDAALGAGATAVVYRAHDLRLGRDVAVKVLLPNLARDPLVAGRFDREARALAAAAHPGIVSVFDVDRGDPATGREPFFVMELCDGGSLADVIDGAGGRLSPEILAPMLATIAAGLASLHARGVIHRDIKPHNILICGSGAKLADFGLARAADMTNLTAAGTGAGTLAYLAPELLGGVEPGPPADVYGLGTVAFQGLTGRLPRPSTSMVDLVATRLGAMPPVSAVAPDLGRAFDGVVGAALSPDPARRPSPLAFATGLGQALQSWQAQGPVVPGMGAGPDMSTQQIRIPRSAGRGGVGPADRGQDRRGSLVGPVIAAILLGILAAIVILVLVSGGGIGPGPTARTSASPTVRPTAATSASPGASAFESPSPSPSASPSPSPSPSPTPSPSETPVPTPVITPVPTVAVTRPPIWSPSAARNDLNNISTAIDSARINGFFHDKHDIDDLRKAADAVDKPLAKEDRAATARAVQKLQQTLQEIVGAGRLDNAGELQNAVDHLVQDVGPP